MCVYVNGKINYRLTTVLQLGLEVFFMEKSNANVKKRVMASALLCASVWAQTVASGIILLVLTPK